MKRVKERVKELQFLLILKLKNKRMRITQNNSILRPMTNTRTWKSV